MSRTAGARKHRGGRRRSTYWRLAEQRGGAASRDGRYRFSTIWIPHVGPDDVVSPLPLGDRTSADVVDGTAAARGGSYWSLGLRRRAASRPDSASRRSHTAAAATISKPPTGSPVRSSQI